MPAARLLHTTATDTGGHALITLLTGDVREALPTLPSNSVQCCVTSPPYFGLRDYGTAQWEGGDAGCEHKQDFKPAEFLAGNGKSAGCTSWQGSTRHASSVYRDTCGKCGARRIDAQIGLEPTPDAYIQTMVEVFREVRRVLRDDGTCWVNMGDSYAGSPAGNFGGPKRGVGPFDDYRSNTAMNTTKHAKPKDLLMMPARLALALQADGWWLRSDIIWAKPNPMPESCRDRPTSAHEHVFLLTKRSRYFYDGDAVREPHAEPWRSDGRPERMGARSPDDFVRPSGMGAGDTVREYNPAGRDLRNVWNIATSPFPAAHFATFPPELAERCIRAGTSERGACAACSAPWVRVTDSERRPGSSPQRNDNGSLRSSGNGDRNDAEDARWHTVSTTTGWSPSCQCNADVVPCKILDPFSGAGTALLVADRLGRDSIGIDLNHAYVEMARERLQRDCPLFAEITDAPIPEPPEDERMADLFAEAAE